MNRIKLSIAKWLLKGGGYENIDASKGSKGTARELASTVVKPIVYKSGTSSGDFEDPDNDFTEIQAGYNTDSYIRQGVDKYVDQVFKEGYNFYGNDINIVAYLKLRLDYIAEGTNIPTNQFLIDIAEDIVKYGNAYIVKVRGSDDLSIPEGLTIAGLDGKDPIVGYFLANPVTMKCKRDDYGMISSWQQESDSGSTQEFAPEDVIHFYYKKERGAAYGTSFLVPVLDDVRALRQAEENVLKMMYRNIYPFYHAAVGSTDAPGNEKEVVNVQETMNNMDVEGGIATTERVTIKPIASNQVIDAEPYLRYMEERVFSGMGIPPILFGRGGTSNRSTGDNMTSEMADRIRAICKVVEMFINSFIIKELLMEGGYDPIVAPEQVCEFRFNDNDVDVKIKKETHAIYKYEHNSISEDEMRHEMGLDPISDEERKKMHFTVITLETANNAADNAQATATKESGTGTKETNNKEKNSGGAPKTSKSKNKGQDSLSYEHATSIGFIKDLLNDMTDDILKDIKTNNVTTDSLFKKISVYNKSILSSVDKEIQDEIQSMLVKQSTIFCNQLSQEIMARAPDINDCISTVTIIFDVYIDTVIAMIINKMKKGE